MSDPARIQPSCTLCGRCLIAEPLPTESPSRPTASPPATQPVPRLSVGVVEAAEALGVSTDTVRTMVATGRLTARRLGRRLVIPMRALEHLVGGEGEP